MLLTRSVSLPGVKRIVDMRAAGTPKADYLRITAALTVNALSPLDILGTTPGRRSSMRLRAIVRNHELH